jgi:hypothetical protein
MRKLSYNAKPPPWKAGVCGWMAGGEWLDPVSRQGPTKSKRVPKFSASASFEHNTRPVYNSRLGGRGDRASGGNIARTSPLSLTTPGSLSAADGHFAGLAERVPDLTGGAGTKPNLRVSLQLHWRSVFMRG